MPLAQPAEPCAAIGATARRGGALRLVGWLVPFALLGAVLVHLFPDSYQADAGYHFLFARGSLEHPRLLVDVWGRPLFTALYAIPAQAGYPIRMSEMLATVDGASYLERTSVHNVAGVVKTKAAIKKAFQCQLDGKGFSMVEILSMCPTNWGTRLDNPSEATKFVAEDMVKVFPPGVYKELK